MTRAGAAFDAGALEQLYAIDGTGEVLEELALLFLRDMAISVEALLRAVEEGELGDVHRAAHTIKGLAPTFGAMELGRVAERIVDDALADRAPQVGDVEALSPALAVAGDALREAVARKRAPGPTTGETPT